MRLVGALAAVTGVTVIALGIQPSQDAASHAETASNKAPSFRAKGTDGKVHTLESLTKNDKAVVLYFIGNTCPVNGEAIPYFKQIEKAYKGKVNFVGVIDGDREIYTDWNKEFKTKFTVLYDPDFTIIKKYKALASPWAVLVNPDGEIVKTLSGYSGNSLQSLSNEMSKYTDGKAATINTNGAPEDDIFG